MNNPQIPTPRVSTPPPPMQPGMPRVVPAPIPVPAAPKMVEPDLDPIALVDDEPPTPLPPSPVRPVATGAVGAPVPQPAAPASKIRAFSVAQTHQHNTNYKRKTSVNGTGICRMRTFHGRLSDEGLAFMDDKINEWLDNNPDVEVKFVTSTIGMYDGKIKEPALIMNVWY